MTWRAGLANELTWRAGPPRGCNVALRPRGRGTGGPREVQVAHRARTHGRRRRMSTRVHADAREVVQMLYRTPLFNLTYRYIFFRLGLCPKRFLPFAGDVDAWQALDLVNNDRKALIAWTRVHAIIKSGTCVKDTLSGRNRRAHRAPHGITRSAYHHQGGARAIAI